MRVDVNDGHCRPVGLCLTHREMLEVVVAASGDPDKMKVATP